MNWYIGILYIFFVFLPTPLSNLLSRLSFYNKLIVSFNIATHSYYATEANIAYNLVIENHFQYYLIIQNYIAYCLINQS